MYSCFIYLLRCQFIVYFLPLLQCQFYCYKFFYLLTGLFLSSRSWHIWLFVISVAHFWLFFFYFFGCSVLWHMRSSFLSRDWNHSACTEILVLTTGPLGKSLIIYFLEYIFTCAWLKLSQIYLSYRKYVVFHINF